MISASCPVELMGRIAHVLAGPTPRGKVVLLPGLVRDSGVHAADGVEENAEPASWHRAERADVAHVVLADADVHRGGDDYRAGIVTAYDVRAWRDSETVFTRAAGISANSRQRRL